jgi:DNA sulfur modification protein DndD
MLRLKRLAMSDFGPYKGTQEFVFPEGSGVTIVYGENRRGKTSFLNAIRYALLGVVVTRGSRNLDFHKVVNREARDEGRDCFSVSLDFDFEGDSYELERRCEARQSIASPARSEDYNHYVYLKRAGSPVSQAETTIELARIMPPQIARFFLFDGELLSQYEELLREKGESDVGARISLAIEQILGLPVLQNAREDVTLLAEEAAQQESRAAQRDAKTQRIGGVLENLAAMQQQHRSELARLLEALASAQTQKTLLEDLLARSVGLDVLLTERVRLDAEIAAYESQIAEKQGKLREALSKAWRAVLSSRLVPLRERLESERKDLEAQIARGLFDVYRRQQINEAIETGRCPICQTPVQRHANWVESESESKLRLGAFDFQSLQNRASEIQQQLDIVNRIAAGGASHAVDISEDIESASVALHARKGRRDEILDQISDYNEDDFRVQRKQYEAIIKKIAILQNGVDAETAELSQIEVGIRDARMQLNKHGLPGLHRERQRREAFEKIAALLGDGVKLYRERLRLRVQQDASTLFSKLTSEPDDAGLRINDQYGLTIVHKDGTDITVRSSGAEHIVALSLVGALQRNAPLRGPLIMDSLLIRIDDAHRDNVVRALPTMAEQVILLVFGAELRPENARSSLRNALLAEFELKRVSSRHTDILPLRGS